MPFANQAGVNWSFFVAGRVYIQRQQNRRALRAATHGYADQDSPARARSSPLVIRYEIVVAGYAAAQQVYSALRQLFRTQLFCSAH